MPRSRAASAVAGPTHAATTRVRNAASSASSDPSASAMRQMLATADGEVKVITVSWPSSASRTRRRAGPSSSGGTHRYTGTAVTLAPASRSALTAHGASLP